MPSTTISRATRGVASFAVGVIATAGLVFGVAGTADAAHPNPHLHSVRVSTKRVAPGGTFSIVAKARYRVVEDYEVIFTFDLAKVDLPDETCDDGNGPQNADNPSCEYDNGFLSKTTTIGYFRVAPDATGTISVTTCAQILQTGAHTDCKVRRIHITGGS
jgi:hypothetical protein